MKKLLLLSLLVLSGCYELDHLMQPKYTPPSHPTPKTAVPQETQAEREAAERAAQAKAQEQRNAFVERANAVADLEGHPKGREFVAKSARCENPRWEGCGWNILEAKKVAPATTHAAVALFESNPEKAERMMVEAEELAAKQSAERKAAADKYKKDDEAVAAELKACADDKKPCLDRCKADTASAACVALGVYTVTGSKEDRFETADNYFDPACKAGMKPACVAQEKARKERNIVFAPVDAAWSSLVQIGDDLATKKFLHGFAATHLSGPRNARGVQNMALHIAAITRDDFCPAKKEFLRVSNAVELTKRAKRHCDNDPPAASGLGGQEEVLTTQCRAVFATPCP